MTETPQQELARYRQWVSDLQSAMYVNCVFCGHRYGPLSSAATTSAEILREHIEQCEQHPLSYARADLRSLIESFDLALAEFQNTNVAGMLRGFFITTAALDNTKRIQLGLPARERQ